MKVRKSKLECPMERINIKQGQFEEELEQLGIKMKAILNNEKKANECVTNKFMIGDEIVYKSAVLASLIDETKLETHIIVSINKYASDDFVCYNFHDAGDDVEESKLILFKDLKLFKKEILQKITVD